MAQKPHRQTKTKYNHDEVHKIAKDVSQQVLNNYAGKVAHALEQTFKEEYGFGEKRMKKLLDQLNNRLPEGIQFVYKG